MMKRKVKRKGAGIVLMAVVSLVISLVLPQTVYAQTYAGRSVEDGEDMEYYIDDSYNLGWGDSTRRMWTTDPESDYFSGHPKIYVPNGFATTYNDDGSINWPGEAVRKSGHPEIASFYVGSTINYDGSAIAPTAEAGGQKITGAEEGDRIKFDENIQKYILTKYLINNLSSGYPDAGLHVGYEDVDHMDVGYWEVNGMFISCHGAGGQDDKGLHYWHDNPLMQYYTYRGFKFTPNGQKAPKTVYNLAHKCEMIGNSVAWGDRCALCGASHPILFYGSKNAYMDLPVLDTYEDAPAFGYTCRLEGGMEQGTGLGHKCYTLYPDTYSVNYNINTNDPEGVGITSPTYFYYDLSQTEIDNLVTKYLGKYNTTNQAAKNRSEAEFRRRLEAIKSSYNSGAGTYTYWTDGKAVTTDRRIAENGFYRPGYRFTGWNTKQDGTGVSFNPGDDVGVIFSNSNYASIRNKLVTGKNGASFTLYAQWEPVVSTLKIVPEQPYMGGATYAGQAEFSVDGYYRLNATTSAGGDYAWGVSDYKANPYVVNDVQLPTGYTVNYNGMGGTPDRTSDTATTYIMDSQLKNADSSKEAFGSYVKNGTLGTYYYGPQNPNEAKNTDIVSIQFGQNTITLPNASAPNQMFIGWYEESTFKNYAGKAGDAYVIKYNGQTLYAKFESLGLDIEEVYYYNDGNTNNQTYGGSQKDSDGPVNYANGSRTPGSSYAALNATGAVNLKTKLFTNTTNMAYTAYMNKSGATEYGAAGWEAISVYDTNGGSISFSTVSDSTPTASGKTVDIKYPGLYHIVCKGAQGAAYNGQAGGYGGVVEGDVLLYAGDQLIYTVGGQNGTNGGGTGQTYGANGGGYTEIKLKRGGSTVTLMTAGGGGGGSNAGAGGNANGGTYVASGQNGQNSASGAGGGGGNVGGQAGLVEYHFHTSSCYGPSEIHVNNPTNTTFREECNDDNDGDPVDATAYLLYNGGNFNSGDWAQRYYENCQTIITSGISPIPIPTGMTSIQLSAEVAGMDGGHDEHNNSKPWVATDASGLKYLSNLSSCQYYIYNQNGRLIGYHSFGQSDRIPVVYYYDNYTNTDYDDCYMVGFRPYKNSTNMFEFRMGEDEDGAEAWRLIGPYSGADYFPFNPEGRYSWSDYDAVLIEEHDRLNKAKAVWGDTSLSVCGWGDYWGTTWSYLTWTFNIPSGTTGLYIIMAPPTCDGWSEGHIYSPRYTWHGNAQLTCAYKNYASGAAVINSKGGYGGSNSLNGSYILNGSTVYNDSHRNAGNGNVNIAASQIFGTFMAGDYVLKNVYARDTLAPRAVDVSSVKINFPNTSQTTVAWAPVETTDDKRKGAIPENTYSYYVKAQRWEDTGGYWHFGSSWTSPIVQAKTASQLAGYYYFWGSTYNGDSNYIRNHVASHYSGNYTWTNTNCGSGLTFTQGTSVTLSQTSGYIYIAPVDVAGNVGPTIVVDITRGVPVGRVVFNTNKLDYVLTKDQVYYNEYLPSVHYGAHTVDAPGQNAPNKYLACYFSSGDPTKQDNSGKGLWISGTNQTSVNYGAQYFPGVNSTGSTLIGWNTKADGTGTYLSGPSELAGIVKANETVNLYAIWDDKVDIRVAAALDPASDPAYGNLRAANAYNRGDKQITYLPDTTGTSTSIKKTVTVLDTITTADGEVTPKFKTYTTLDGNVWSTDATITTAGQSSATGVYSLVQNLKDMDSGTALTKITDYVGGIGNTIHKYAATELRNPNGTASVQNYGNSAARPDSDYSTAREFLKVTYDVQGTFKVSGVDASRSVLQNPNGTANIPGAGCVKNTGEMVMKVDRTPPKIEYFKVYQDRLENYPVDSLDTAYQSATGLTTTFTVTASDYANTKYGPCMDDAHKKDTAGIEGVYVYAHDAENPENGKVFPMSLVTVTENTMHDSHVLKGEYTLTVNLYEELPNVSDLKYHVYVVDNAGNVSNLKERGTFPGGPDEEVTPGDEEEKESEIVGSLVNFSLKTVIYNDTVDMDGNNPWNMGEGMTFFRTGDTGHVEVWSVGHVPYVALNFGLMGVESAEEIAAGQLDYKFNLGVEGCGDVYRRHVPWTKAEEIHMPSFVYYDETTGTRKTTYPGEAKYNELAYDEDGIPYAQHFVSAGWLAEGMSVRMPPNYELTEIGEDEYGEMQYEWEMWEYSVTSKKYLDSAEAKNTYIIWGKQGVNTHNRTTHENP